MKYLKFPILSSFIFAVAVALTSCSSISVNDYSSNKPTFIPQEFFNGDLTAHGVVKNRSGKVTRYFSATIKAYWQNGIGTLEEKFIFNDGEIQNRVWKLTPEKNIPNQFTATANDVVGTGNGKFSGNAVNLNYVLEVKYNDSKINLSVKDWMWLLDEKTVLNESELTKFGFKVGSIQLVMTKN